MASFGERVVAHREALGMSQRALAERIGLTFSHLNRIEKGTRKPPAVEKVLAMNEVLRLTRAQAEELVTLAGYSPLVLAAGGGLSYSSPSLPGVIDQQMEGDLSRLRGILGHLSPQQRQACIDALVALVRALTDDQARPGVEGERKES